MSFDVREMNQRSPAAGDFLGHPKGLYVLFLTEMWERFSYYGMRVLLIFYLTKHFLFDDERAILIVGSYNALVNASPLIGGFMADRYLGFKKAVILGALLMLFGHIGMAWEGAPAYVINDGAGSPVIHRDTFSIATLYFSLALLIIGVGFLKPSVSSIVGTLYDHGDSRRESGFIIFQMGINLGAAIAAVLCGYLGQTFGWAYGFGSAAIAMLIGLMVFLGGQNVLRGYGLPPDIPRLKTRIIGRLSNEHINYVAVLILVIVTWRLLYYPEFIGKVLLIAALWCFAWLAWIVMHAEKVQKDRILALSILLAFFLCYVIFIEQVSTSLNLFIDRNVDRSLAGATFQASQIYAIYPAMCIVFAPFLAWTWLTLGKRNRNPGIPIKFAMGFAILSLAYYLIILGAAHATDSQVGLMWVVLFFVLFALSDLFVVPIAISSVTYLSPKDMMGLVMGIYFFSISAANFLAAKAAEISAVPGANLQEIDKASSLAIYINLFIELAVAAVVLGGLMAMLNRLVKNLMH